jgi:1-acyl-sn-glycerol-3-phosphate acyltransferase
MPSGPKIYCSSHPTSLDPCYVYDLTDNASILMTQFVFDLPVVGRIMRGCGFIPVAINGTKARHSAYSWALNELLKGRNIMIAPEGKMSPDNPSGRAKTGAVRLSHEADVPIIPMGIRHVGKVYMFDLKDQPVRYMPRGDTFIRFGRPMYHYWGLASGAPDFRLTTDRLMDRIHELSTP